MQIIPAWVKVDHNSYNAKLRGIYKNVRENDITAACEQAKRLYTDLLMELEVRGIDNVKADSAVMQQERTAAEVNM